ncbi:MAG: putative RNA polymerase sigma factor containing a TPR repeat domain, partial [Porphyrobacter sp. HL-46]
GLA